MIIRDAISVIMARFRTGTSRAAGIGPLPEAREGEGDPSTSMGSQPTEASVAAVAASSTSTAPVGEVQCAQGLLALSSDASASVAQGLSASAPTMSPSVTGERSIVTARAHGAFESITVGIPAKQLPSGTLNDARVATAVVANGNRSAAGVASVPNANGHGGGASPCASQRIECNGGGGCNGVHGAPSASAVVVAMHAPHVPVNDLRHSQASSAAAAASDAQAILSRFVTPSAGGSPASQRLSVRTGSDVGAFDDEEGEEEGDDGMFPASKKFKHNVAERVRGPVAQGAVQACGGVRAMEARRRGMGQRSPLNDVAVRHGASDAMHGAGVPRTVATRTDPSAPLQAHRE